MKSGGVNLFIAILVGIFVLIFLANYLVSIKAVPSLSEYIASTTSSFAVNSKDQSLASTTTIIKTPKGDIKAEIANTTELIVRGLSYRESLPKDHGMLFVFSLADKYSFWMKDMNFPIDIIWINADKVVTEIDANISPKTYPNLYTPKVPAKYVLELNAKATEEYDIVVGTQLAF